ncbi:hypothetical protein [Paenibacillus rigui]|uniref:Uncharacterized protein n=1 Tax=Paenibacillus rigui TaxID=554312 RepID=A0A229UVE5_9BACL|nr:hypothetical protein [Paenibacillus rigui]OXM87506.1 hypothetical protein CF651_05250 [Paenibacillus rigui]
MTLNDLVTEAEYGDVLNGVKDLLKETYCITEHEADSVVNRTLDNVDVFLDDYIPYIQSLKTIQGDLRETLDEHLKQAVDNEHTLQLKMTNDAAIWLAYECIRRFCKRNF